MTLTNWSYYLPNLFSYNAIINQSTEMESNAHNKPAYIAMFNQHLYTIIACVSRLLESNNCWNKTIYVINGTYIINILQNKSYSKNILQCRVILAEWQIAREFRFDNIIPTWRIVSWFFMFSGCLNLIQETSPPIKDLENINKLYCILYINEEAVLDYSVASEMIVKMIIH